jgi:hypothetical protein
MATELSQGSVPETEADVARLRQPRLSFAAELQHASQQITVVVP